MTVGLSNSASRARNYGSTVNINQGGGSKKAGFPFQIGRNYRTSIAFESSKLTDLQKPNLVLANISRNLGRNGNPSYWKVA